MLESKVHASSVVVTLTYAEEPPGRSLVPRDTELWLKRLRKAVEPLKLRYFLCGEYGDANDRPHYHAVVFGLPLDPGHGWSLVAAADGQYECRCATCVLVRETWGLGRIEVQPFDEKGAQYVCGYVTKKMTKAEDPRLQGRVPEFAHMSRRRGLGAMSTVAMAEALSDASGVRVIGALGDVPSTLQHGRKKWPLGRYLRRCLREELGFAEIGGQSAVLAEQAEELRALCARDGTAETLARLHEENRVRCTQVETKFKIHSQKGSL